MEKGYHGHLLSALLEGGLQSSHWLPHRGIGDLYPPTASLRLMSVRRFSLFILSCAGLPRVTPAWEISGCRHFKGADIFKPRINPRDFTGADIIISGVVEI